MGITPLQQHEVQTAKMINKFAATVPSETKPETLENEKWWFNIAPRLKPGDEIRVVPKDFAYVARMFVRFVSGNNVSVRLLSCHFMDPIGKDDYKQPEYEVCFMGADGWCVVKTDTKEVLIKDVADEQSAHREKDNYILSMSR